MYQKYVRTFDVTLASQNRPHPIGRPPKLNEQIIEEICDHIHQGTSLAKAANLAGVSESTFHRWMASGMKSEANSLTRVLYERVTEAIELSEYELLQYLHVSLEEDRNWKVATWLLERRFPEKYGKVNKTEISLQNKPEVPGYGELAVIRN